MPDKKLTDAEIVKACKDCLHYDACKGTYSSAKGDEDILYEFDGEMYAESGCEDFKDKDLINRLQAENERLKVEYEESQKRNSDLVNAFQGYKAEAYKECIEKLKKLMEGWGDLEYYSEAIKAETDLDNLLKELVGENQCQE